MDADTVLRIRPALTDYLKEFDDRFGRVTTRRHLDTNVEGQLSDLRRKNVEPITDAAGTPTRWSIARSTRSPSARYAGLSPTRSASPG